MAVAFVLSPNTPQFLPQFGSLGMSRALTMTLGNDNDLVAIVECGSDRVEQSRQRHRLVANQRQYLPFNLTGRLSLSNFVFSGKSLFLKKTLWPTKVPYIMQGLEVLGPSGLQAPTSSWWLFGPFDFALHALRTLRHANT